MSTNQPPDLAAIRARSEAAETEAKRLVEALESESWLSGDHMRGIVYALADSVPALLDEIDRLRAGIQSIIDNDRSDSWITVDLQTLLG